jgi:glycosyltransferase involved in cell wall biosynthesis
LPKAIESARNQTYPNLEIIVSDNCSIDHTERLVTGIIDSRIRHFKHPMNIGSNKNLNFCLKEAKGEHFLLLCDDDLIDEDFIETCMKAAQYKTDTGVILTGVRLIDAKGRVRSERPNMTSGYPTDAFFRAWFAGKAPLYLCNTLFNTKRFREIDGFRSKHNLYDDVMAIVQLAAKYGRIDIHEIKASPRLHESKLGLAAEIADWCEDSLILLDLMCDLVSENRALIRQEGMRVFSRRNYSRARVIRSPLKRFMAYMIVFKKFNYRHPPPLYPRRFHPQRLRGIRMKMKRLLSMG